MKKLSIATVVSCILYAGVSHIAQADGGSVHLHAMVTAASCTVSNETRDQTVDMGTISQNVFTGAGSESARVPFTINLVACPSATTTVGFTTAGVTHGSADANDNSLFALDPTSAASGVGIALYDAASAGNQITPGSAATVEYTVNNGNASIPLSATVKQSTGTVVGGDFSSVVGFSIVYN